MKLRPSDCLRILRQFGEADDEAVPRDVSRLLVSNPRPTSTLASFRFGGAEYLLLFDDDADDDQGYIAHQINQARPGREFKLLANPLSDITTYALPYEGKATYLMKIDANKQRLDIYLSQTRPELSRSSWQKHIRAGRVSVDYQVQVSPKHAVGSANRVVVELPEAPSHDDRQLPITYIDDDVIVIDKPAGVLTHSKNQLDHEFTVADFFRGYTQHGLDGDRPGVVHRLDRDTSGLIIGARHQLAYDYLKQQFAERSVTKTYYAVVAGAPEKPKLDIELPIIRDPTRPGAFTVKRGGKSAQTSVRLVKRGDTHSLLELKPLTGRTHQLRVHLASIGLPIVGDRLYGSASDRLFLHASALELKLPSGQTANFNSDLPAEFTSLVTQGIG